MRIAIDIDGVVADFGHTIMKYLAVTNPGMTIEDVDDYTFQKFGMSQKKLHTILRNFQFTREYLTMPAIEGAVEGVNALYDEQNQIFFVTARNQYLTVCFDTARWLQKKGFKYNGVFCDTPDKLPLCRDLGTNLLIDDMPATIEQFEKVKRPTIVYDQPWNQKVKESKLVRRCTDWKQIVKLCS